MASYAIVIGINEYPRNPAWNLDGAVNDALSFARWAIAEGGVPPENLELLLSPDGDAETDLPYKQADREQIGEAIDAFIDGRGEGGDRLYFYYAGHGVSAPRVTQGAIQQPVLLPQDVKSLKQTNLFLSFADVMPRLLNVPPQTQFFFIDACRDFALEDEFVTTGAGFFDGRWSPPKPEAGPRSAQYVIYATAPGQKALEKKLLGRGLFGPALVKGLSGETSATVWRNPSYELTFSTLFRYVRAQVERAVEAAKGSSSYVQLPGSETLGGPPDVLLSSYKERPDVPVKVRVDPKDARPSCLVQLVYPQPGGGESVVKKAGPPAQYTSTFQIAPGDYVVRAEASEYATAEEAMSLYEAVTIPFELEPALLAAAGGFAITRGIEAVDEGADGTLKVSALDDFALVVIWDSEQRIVKSKVGESSATELPPGIYRVQLVLPDGPADEKTIQIRAGRTTTVNLRPAPHRFGSAQADMLESHGLHVREGYVHVAESIGAVASPPMASLLGFAALAAQWPTGELAHLRSLGVDSSGDLPDGRSALIVLVGTSEEEPGRFSAGGDFIVRGSDGQVLHEGGFQPLDGFPAAAQAHIELDVGPLVLELRLPGLAPTRYALSALPNRVTVLIAVAEGPGAFETQQYMFPCDEAGFMEAFPDGDPKHVRALELAQRYYAGGRLLPKLWDIDALLMGKWLDPLLACVAGYSLVKRGQAERFIGEPNQQAYADQKEQSAMRNMLKFFGELPDSHVLAGLCEPEHTAEHFSNALARGLPIFSDGLRALHDWYANRDAPPPALREPAESLLPGSPWTAWVASRID